MEKALYIFSIVFLCYLLIGVLFGIYFFIKGASKIDPLIKDSKWTVRLLLVPGAIGLWPIIFKKVFQKK